jgi:hypothetical protein
MTSDESSRHPLTRRQLALLVGALPFAARTAAAAAPPTLEQALSPSAPAQAAAAAAQADSVAKAQADIRKNSERLRQVELATDVEPAFVFRP